MEEILLFFWIFRFFSRFYFWKINLIFIHKCLKYFILVLILQRRDQIFLTIVLKRKKFPCKLFWNVNCFNSLNSISIFWDTCSIKVLISITHEQWQMTFSFLFHFFCFRVFSLLFIFFHSDFFFHWFSKKHKFYINSQLSSTLFPFDIQKRIECSRSDYYQQH